MLKSESNQDLNALKRSPGIGSQDLNNVKLGQGQPRLNIQTYFVLPYMGMPAILVK